MEDRAGDQGRTRFIIAGLSRLAVPVARKLHEHGPVLILADPESEIGYAELVAGVAEIEYHTHCDRALERMALGDTGLHDVRCVLALADKDAENFKVAARCHEIDPKVLVVLRTLDSSLADEVELVDKGLSIHRAYDMAALAAPEFVALALSDEEQALPDDPPDPNRFDPITMRFGPDEIPLRKLKVQSRSPLRGKSPAAVRSKLKCAVIAVRRGGGAWRPGPTERRRLAVGDEVVLGGRQIDVFRAARGNSTRFQKKSRIWLGRLKRGNRGGLLVAALFFSVFMLAVSVLLGVELKLTPWQVPYKTIVTAAGEETLRDQSIHLQLFAFCSIVVWAILGGLLVSWVTDWAVEKRLGRRPSDFVGHAVVCGLGDVGYRVAKLLDAIDIPTVVLTPPGDRFVNGISWKVPIIEGNIRLADELKRAGVERAACVIAVTEEDMANIAACMHAERMKAEAAARLRNGWRRWLRATHKGPDGQIRTVARLFDDDFYNRFSFKDDFNVDVYFAAVEVAAAAYVDAAIGADAVRHFKVGGQDYLGRRHELKGELTAAKIAEWADDGVVVVASRVDTGPVEGPNVTAPDSRHKKVTLVLVGPEGAIRALAAEGDKSSAASGAPDAMESVSR